MDWETFATYYLAAGVVTALFAAACAGASNKHPTMGGLAILIAGWPIFWIGAFGGVSGVVLNFAYLELSRWLAHRRLDNRPKP